MRKRLKRKLRSCPCCKPNKTGGCDRRTLQWKKQDEADKDLPGHKNLNFRPDSISE